MSVYGVTNSQTTTYSTSTVKNNTAAKSTDTSASEKAKEQDTGVVYEPSGAKESKDANSKVTDYSKVAKQLRSAQDAHNQQLQNLVNQLLSKQANKYTSLSQLFQDVRDGKISVDSSTVLQAQKDIAEDGYWGVEQTSERLFSMAKALSGGDPEKADTMIAAIKKGYEQAEKAWGGKLPDICQQTIDAATKKMDDWRKSFNTPDAE